MPQSNSDTGTSRARTAATWRTESASAPLTGRSGGSDVKDLPAEGFLTFAAS